MPAKHPQTGELFPYRSLREILTGRPATVHAVAPGDPVSAAVALMSGHGIGLVVVLDGAQLAGVLSERDLVRRAGQPDAAGLGALPVSALMKREVVTVGPDEQFGRCLALMDEHGIRHLPVVDAGRVVAVISIRDLLHEAVAHHRRVLAEVDRERLSAFQAMY
jgi:CBS domain-containing protein